MNASVLDDEAIFHAARGIPDPNCRREYVRSACGTDTPLVAQVEALLAAADAPDKLLDSPVVGSTVPANLLSPLEAPGSVIGPYKLVEQIGEGGMGLVFMADQSQPVRRLVALKVLKPGLDTRHVLARFEAERQALAMMEHPHIAKVFDAGTTPAGRPYFVMELVHGVPITEFCDQRRLDPRRRLELFVEVCRAVQHAHQKGVIHRDLKPSNVLVTLHDTVAVPKVIDFGIAKATGERLTERTLVTHFAQMVGTPLYMSPEQAEMNGLDVDTRSDVYALGVLLYELLTGATPFGRERLKSAGCDEVRRILREEEPPRPSRQVATLSAAAIATVAEHRGVDARQFGHLLRGDLDWVVMKALEKDRNRRYESASAFAQDVERYLAGEAVQARPPSATYRLRKFAGRNRGTLGFAGTAAALFLSVGWWVADWGGRKAETERVVAQALAESVDLQQEGKYAEALSAARRADGLIAGGTVRHELRGQVERRRAELDLVRRLDEVHLEGSAVKDGHFDGELTNRRYGEEFRAAAMDFESMSVEEAADRIRNTSVATELSVALDDWSLVCPQTEQKRRLRHISRMADPDDWRRELRTVSGPAARKALLDLAAAEDVVKQPPRSQAQLGHLLNQIGETKAAAELLRQAQQAYPSDFWINHQLGYALQFSKPAQYQEAVRFYSVAVALRPQSPGARLNLGGVLVAADRRDEAIAAYLEAIRLQTDFAAPYFGLGKLLVYQEDDGDAGLILLREAARLDPRGSLRIKNPQFLPWIQLIDKTVSGKSAPARKYPPDLERLLTRLRRDQAIETQKARERSEK